MGGARRERGPPRHRDALPPRAAPGAPRDPRDDARVRARRSRSRGGVDPDVARALPVGVELNCIVAPAPGSAGRALVLAATAFADTVDEARAWLAPLEDAPVAASHASHVEPATFDGLLASMAASFPAGARYAADSRWSPSSPVAVLRDAGGRARGVAVAGELRAVRPVARASARSAAAAGHGVLAVRAGLPRRCTAAGPTTRRTGRSLAGLRRAQAVLEPLATGHHVRESA